MSLPSLPSPSPPTVALLASTTSTSTFASLIYSSPAHPTSISTSSSASPHSLAFVSSSPDIHSSPAIPCVSISTTRPSDSPSSAFPSPHVCDTTTATMTHRTNCHYIQPSSPPSCSGGPSSPSNMTEHLQNLILLMEELSTLRSQSSHLSAKVESLGNSQLLDPVLGSSSVFLV